MCYAQQEVKQLYLSYTNPSRPQSKGLEASSGVELYLVAKALNLELKKFNHQLLGYKRT